MTRAPQASAYSTEPSLEPLSAIRISPATPERARNSLALPMQVAMVSASLRHGIRMVSSTLRLSAASRPAGSMASGGNDSDIGARDPVGGNVLAATILSQDRPQSRLRRLHDKHVADHDKHSAQRPVQCRHSRQPAGEG